MLRRLVLCVCLMSIALIVGLTTNCGSSYSNSTKPCTGTYNVVGDWDGTLSSSSGTTDLVGVINSAGDAVFFDNSADIAVLPGVTGACAISTTATVYTSAADGNQTLSGTVTGNVDSASSITATLSGSAGSGSLTFATYAPITAVTALTGLAIGAVQGQTTDTISFTLGGTASSITANGNDGNCNFNVTFTEEGTNNVYDVAFNVSGGTCGTIPLTGVGFESTTDLLGVDPGAPAGQVFLYALVTSGTGPFVVEIY